MKILILCTGNSCRSQMTEGYIRHFNPSIDVYSAGTAPACRVHPLAIKVMAEDGIDISNSHTKLVDEFLDKEFDYVITVCEHAKETCPVFTGKVKKQHHVGFDDPAEAIGTEEEVLAVFRRVRDEIKQEFKKLLDSLHEKS